VFVADTDHDRILFVDGLCATRAWLPGPGPSGMSNLFDHPRGLAVGDDGLWVADTGNARVLHFAFPALELDVDLVDGFQQPTAVALDSKGRVYVLDRGLNRVRRYARSGTPDGGYNVAVAASGKLSQPLWLAMGGDDLLFISDGARKTIFCFDDTGTFKRELVPPPTAWRPGALAADATRVFAADMASGRIEVFLSDGIWWCTLPDFCGPVAALALTSSGDLLIKTALDDTYVTFAAEKMHAATGTATSGPYDAGEKLEWFRAAAQADVPRGTAVTLEVVQWEAPTPPPTPGDWIPAKAFDALLAPLLPPGPPPSSRRFLWLRATLSTQQPALTPVLQNLRAETPGEDYRNYLPEIYKRSDEPELFLFRLLALTRGELGAVEENIDAVPQLLSPDFVPYSELPWLARWLGLELPRIATDAERRDLIKRTMDFYRRRGTPAGICDFVEIYTAIRPSLVEAFEERGLWVLDVSSLLGFDTGLPAVDPLGMVVPDSANPLAAGEECCPTPIGSAVVGEAGPLEVRELGKPLFLDAAHRFTVFLPAYRAENGALRKEVRRIIDGEKPAHTDYHLCLIEPDLRVGFQAQVGIDTIVGGSPPPLRLDAARIGMETNLPAAAGKAPRVGQNASVGYTMVLG
jgi:phage tail-like protein